MSFYSGLRDTASSLLTTYGAKIVFTRTVKGVYDTATGKRAGDSSTTFNGYGVTMDYRKNQYDGTDILSGDIRLILQATKKLPVVGDQATVGGNRYSVISVTQTKPGNVLVMAECQLRTGTRGTVR